MEFGEGDTEGTCPECHTEVRTTEPTGDLASDAVEATAATSVNSVAQGASQKARSCGTCNIL